MKSYEKLWQQQAARQHGTISGGQLAAAGLSARQIGLRVTDGRLVPVFRGVYRVAGAPPTFHQRVLAACLATGGTASHRTAAVLWELRGCVTGLVELTVAARRTPELRGVVAHTTASLRPAELTERASIPVTAPARTLLDLGAVCAEAVVESALEDALHRRLVSRQALEQELRLVGARGRDGTATLRRLLLARDPTAAPTESPLEDELVRLLRRAGLPEPVRQHWVAAPGHTPVRLDLAYPLVRLAIEVQSMAWHAGRQDLQRDCNKQNLLAQLGWRLLAFTADDIRRRPRAVAVIVRSAHPQSA